MAEPIGWLAEAMFSHLCSAVITVTPRLIAHYQSMGIDAIWVPNAPARRFLEADTRKTIRDEITLGFIGNLRPNCGIEDMWQALTLLNDRGKREYRLFLCGLTLGGFESITERMVVEAPEKITPRRSTGKSGSPGHNAMTSSIEAEKNEVAKLSPAAIELSCK